MVTTSNRLVVADAGPIIHLDVLDCLDLLSDWEPVYVHRAVAEELKRHSTLHVSATLITEVIGRITRPDQSK